MNKSILKTYLPSEAKSLPIYLNDSVSAWWYDSGSLMVNLRATIIDYPHIAVDLSDVAPTYLGGSGNLVPNFNFAIPPTGGIIPDNWSGLWFDWHETNISPTYPIGFMWNYYPRNGSSYQWETAHSISYLTPYNLTNLSYTYIVSGSFIISPGIEYSTSIRFLSDNGYWNTYSNSSLPEKETSYIIKIGNNETIINVEENNYKHLPSYKNRFTLEADYGAIIVYTNSGGAFTELIASGRGRTTNEINQYDTETYIPYTAPVWKTYKSSFTPNGSGTTTARLYIYNRHVQRPFESSNGWRRPYVHADLAVVTQSKPYISQIIGSSSTPINIDSYSSFEADNPLEASEIANLEFPASGVTSTGCMLSTTSGSETTTTYGFYTPGIFDSNDSYILKFGKDDSQTKWLSWIPFSGTPLDSLTEGVRITSASLILTATKDIPSTPSKTCYITTGLEDTNYNTAPSIPTDYNGVANKPFANQLNTAILDSWMTGGEYSIDITNSVKEQLGKKAISWDNASIAAIIKDNNSTIGGYREIASGVHLGYSVPKLKIGYIRNGYPKIAIGTFIQESNPLSNYYNSMTICIGGSSTNHTRSRALLYFNLGSLPDGDIEDAQIFIRSYYASFAGGTHAFDVHAILGGGANNLTKWDLYGATWQKRFGAGANKNWLSTGGDFEPTVLGSIANITNPPVNTGEIIYIPFYESGISKLNSMKSGVVKNHGFLIKDSFESDDTKIMFVSGNHTESWARPFLRVKIGGVWYEIRNYSPSEDIEPYSPKPPQPPSSAISMVKQQFSEATNTDITIDYSLAGDINTNRYLLIASGWNNNNSQWGYDAYFSTLSINGLPMTRVAEVLSDEANLIMWGVQIPNNWQNNTNMIITGNRVGQVSGGSSRIYLYIREFTHVNQSTGTSSIYSTAKNRNGANSAIECVPGGLSIGYAARGWVADAVFLANSNSQLGVPQVGFTHQIRDYSVLQRGFSHFAPGTTDGSVAFNWAWQRADGEYASSGSDNALAIVSLRPE